MSHLATLGPVLLVLCALLPGKLNARTMTFYGIYYNNQDTAQELGGINHIVQDAQGFLWFGGETGLGRYDSQHTRLYRHDPKDPQSIAHNYIRALLVDRAGVLWVGTEAGLCAYRAEFDHFTCHPNLSDGALPRSTVLALFTDAADNLYVGLRSGFYRISADRQRLQSYALPLLENGPPDGNNVVAIEEAPAGRLWLGTADNGLILFDPTTGASKSIAAAPGGLTHNKIRSLATAADGRMWIATYGGGVNVLATDGETFSHFNDPSGEPRAPLSRVIWKVFRDSQDTMWVAPDQGGLVHYAPGAGFFAERHRPYDHTSLPSNQVRTVYEDRNGDLWVGTFPSGVSYYNRATGHITHYKHRPDDLDSLSHSSILALHQDERGNIWLGTEDGLNLLHPENGTFERFQYGPQTRLTAKAVLSIEQYDENTLWVGTWSGGLLAFDLRRREFRPLDTRPKGSSQQNSLFIWDILRDSHNNMWIATEFEGVGLYDRNTQQFQFFSHVDSDPDSLASNFVWALLEDGEHNIWMATNAGLSQWRAATGSLRRIGGKPTGPLKSHRLTSLFQDRDGDLWVGSQDNGVFIYRHETEDFRHLGIEQGLPSPAVSGSVQDRHGQIWLLTTNGLVKLKKSDMVPQVFDARDGLAGNNFNRHAVLLSSQGQLYAGGAEGLNIFRPENMLRETADFPLWLTDLRIMNREVRVDSPNSPTPKAIMFADHLALTHRDLMFSLEFSALNYRLRHNIRYAYKLEGFDREWNTTGQNNSATYTNLPPGDYVFRVRAFTAESQWKEGPALEITMTPAPWRSVWAYLIYAGGLVLSGYLLAHYVKLRWRSRFYQLLSTTDPLTGVHNRMGLTQVAKEWFAPERRQKSLCVLFIDIDHFKRINDRRGHDSGDRILQEVAGVFRQCVRQADYIARWGGEEFVLLCAGVDGHGGRLLAEKIRQQIASHTFDAPQTPLKVTVSIGVAAATASESFEDACKRADRALYLAKDQGRNCVIVAD